ncbi:lysogenization regulator HflD [Marinomonas agarivorans]|nr:lysogenization regulator HflD [Marinomonas agarivorans]
MALSAIFQAAESVTMLAKNGSVVDHNLNPLMGSLLIVNADSPETIYGGHDIWEGNLLLGRQTFIKAMDKAHNHLVNPNTLRYALSILHLEAKLAKQPDMLATIGQRIQQLLRQKEHFDTILHPNMLASASGIYQDTLSKLSFRIQVRGNSDYLKQPQVADQVRTCLLAGVRAAMLWRQLGGRRWHLIFRRGRLLEAIRQV